MSEVQLVIVALAAVIGGSWGWHRGTKRLRLASIFETPQEAAVRRQIRRRQRLMLAIAYATGFAAGAVIGVMLPARGR